jgi:hypothetical protein
MEIGCRAQAEDGEALLGETTGAGVAVRGVASESYGGDFFSTSNHGLVGSTGSASKYSVMAVERIFCGDYLDLDQQNTAPGAPEFAGGRLFLLSNRRLFLLDDEGETHDLTIQHSQIYPAASGATNVGTASAHVLVNWAAGAYPSGATAASVSASGNNSTFSLPTTAGHGNLSEAYARFEWTSQSTLPGQVNNGAQIAIGQTARRQGKAASLAARIRVNNTNRLSHVELSINDANSNVISSGNLLSSLTAGSWIDLAFNDIDVEEFGSNLRIVLTAQGTATAANVGLTQVDIEYLAFRMWENQ